MQNSCGILFISKPTKKIGLGLRADGNSPNTWSTIGGGIEEGESFLECLTREIKEELGIDLNPKLIPIDDNENYKTFISFVDSEFTPTLNKEHSDFKWFDYSELPKNIHPGLNKTLTKPFVQKVLNKHLNETTTDASGSFVGTLNSPIHRGNIGDYIKEDLELKSRAKDQEKQREEYIKDLINKVTKPPIREVKLEDLQKLKEWDIQNDTKYINEFNNRLFEYYYEIESYFDKGVFILKNGEKFQLQYITNHFSLVTPKLRDYIKGNKWHDIVYFSNTKEMFEILDKIMESVNMKENISIKENIKNDGKNYDVIHEDDDLLVINVRDAKTAKCFSQNTQWCSQSNPGFRNHYLSEELQKEYFKNKGLLNETIVKNNNEYCLKSKKGKNLGCYPTKSGAEKRERQVQYFKHLNEYQVSPGETVEWDLENNTTKINRLDGSIEWILQNEHQTLPYLEKLFKTLNKQQIIEFSKRLYNKLSSGGNKRKIIMIGLVTAMINYGISKDDILHEFNSSDIEQLIQKDIKPKIEKQYRGDINDFLNLLAFKESSGNWKKIRYSKKTGNPVYIGKYQFGKIALEDLGVNPDIILQFKDNPNVFPPKMQDNLVKKLLNKNRKYLGDNYLSYDGKTVGGINVTESGLLAASHLRGALAVKKFIDSNGKIDLSDANGTKVSDYMKYFGGFNI